MLNRLVLGAICYITPILVPSLNTSTQCTDHVVLCVRTRTCITFDL